ncbi:hypothetical protein MASR2M47_41880 [Draconibacterium sp.]
MATFALKADVNFRLSLFITTGKFIRFFNLTSGPIFGEYYNVTVSTSTKNAYNAINEINFSSSGAYFTIEGNGTTGGRVIAQAGNAINLNAGFEVKLGGEVLILMDECGTP